jgi:o-succinylbenzoate synthase
LRVGAPSVDPGLLAAASADPGRVAHWERRLADVRALRQDRRS